MKKTLLCLLPLAFAFACLPARAQDAPGQLALAQKSGCLACHAVDKQVVGPPYKFVANKYRGDDKAEDKLVEKVKQGTVGVWGNVPMPPNSFVSDADVRTLVKWILSLQ